MGFRPTLVGHDESIRDYSRNDDESSYQGSTPGAVLNSPVKIGDSYENLKRKMQPFPVVKQPLLFEEDDGEAANSSIVAADAAGDAALVGQHMVAQQEEVYTNSSEVQISNENPGSPVQVVDHISAMSAGGYAVATDLSEAQQMDVPTTPSQTGLVEPLEATAVVQQ